MLETVLCVDIGTTSLKAGLISADGEVVFLYQKSFHSYEDRFVALKWIHILKAALYNFYKTSETQVKIVAISISGNGPTIVSPNGLTLRWNEEFPYDKELTGNSLFLPRLLIFKENFPGEYRKSDYLFSGPEYFIYKLTGNAITLLPEKRFQTAYWDKTLLSKEKVNFSLDKLPPFVMLGEECGKLSSKAAKFFKLEEGIPVFSAGPDFVAALIGTNTLKEGKLCDRCGSSEGINFCVKDFLTSPDFRTLPSSISDLWNVSFLIPQSSKMTMKKRLLLFRDGIEKLREFSLINNIEFPSYLTVTGGQAKNLELLEMKAKISKMELHICNCEDSELLGDAAVAFYGLKKYSSLQEAADNIVKVKSIIK